MGTTETTPPDLSASADGGVVTAVAEGGGAAVKTKFIIAFDITL